MKILKTGYAVHWYQCWVYVYFTVESNITHETLDKLVDGEELYRESVYVLRWY